MDLKNRLLCIFINLFGLPDQITESEINIKNIDNWDSLNHLNLIISIEEEFEITILPNDFPELYNNFNTIYIYINRRLK